jgi:hypothetical protein
MESRSRVANVEVAQCPNQARTFLLSVNAWGNVAIDGFGAGVTIDLLEPVMCGFRLLLGCASLGGMPNLQ